jgi:hypothetical protein
MRMKYTVTAVLLVVFGIFLFENIIAHSNGMTLKTRKNGNSEGCTCHGASPTTSVSVTVWGPPSVKFNDTATYVVKISGGPLLAAGVDISAGRGNVILSPSETFLQRVNVGSWFELTHTSPKAPSPDTARFTFRYIAPSNAGSVDTIFATGNSVNLSGTSSGDQWNFGVFKIINVTATSVRELNEVVTSYNLAQNFPNPFNPTTNIRYGITKAGFVSMKVYDAAGREVADLVNRYQNPGSYEVNFSAGDYKLSSGVYYYRLTAGDFSEVKKMILTK